MIKMDGSPTDVAPAMPDTAIGLDVRLEGGNVYITTLGKVVLFADVASENAAVAAAISRVASQPQGKISGQFNNYI